MERITGGGGKGRICVTGGTGFLGSWIVKKLLEQGYSVNLTTRIYPDGKSDVSCLENLDGAAERLQIFHAELDSPETFLPAIDGCIGVFHTVYPLDFSEQVTEDAILRQITPALKAMLKTCAESKTVRRVVYTSSASAAFWRPSDAGVTTDENSWTDVDFVRSQKSLAARYAVTKTVAEKLALDFASELGLDLVTVCPSWISGPFICGHLPGSVSATLCMIFHDEKYYGTMKHANLVHVDDVARAHIHLFEYPEAKGRYLCTAVRVTIDGLREVISTKYPHYDLPTKESLKDFVENWREVRISSDKLIGTGFRYEHGLEEIIVGAVESCIRKGFILR